MLNFYVYAYLRSDGTPYYIGKGKDRRAFVSTIGHRPPKDRARIVFLERNLSEVGALALERRYIAWYGRVDLGTGTLHNQTSGGEGTSNKSARTIAKMRLANLGKIVSDKTRAKLSTAKKGVRQSPSLVAKRAAAHVGLKRPESFCNSRKGAGNPNSAPVNVNGVHYASMVQAMEALCVSRYVLKKMLGEN